MSQTTNESEDGMMSKDQTDSPLADEGNPESAGGGIALKKGPWTAAEDEILMDYVKKHGEGNWNAVQKHSGLFRCGKSCRLRWANHLRPNLKKGAFTPDEERLIIELHAKMGNKWARMAAHLPGRTDNEIKNYWNTRIKRRQRAGLPLYPPEVCLQAIQEGQQNQNADEIHVGDSGHSDLFETNSYELPDVTFNGLKANQVVFPYVPELNDVSGNSMLMKGLGSSPYHSVLQPTFHCQKRLRESSTLFHHYSGNSSNGLTLFDQTPDDTYDKISQSFGFAFLCDSEPDTGSSLPFDVSNGCHSYINGNFSASKPASGVVKSELPSFQYPETDFGGWGTTSPPQILESVDTLIKSPPQTEVLQSVCFSPRNSGLLDALLHEAKTLSCGKNHSSDKSSNSSADTPGDAAYSPNRYVSETDWDEYGDPISPLAQSAASIFSACTPVSGRGSSSDKHPPFEVFTGCNVNVKSETVDQEYTEGEHKRGTCTQLDFSRPDALLGSGGWLGQGPVTCKNQASMTDTIVSFLGDELGHEYHEQMAAGNSTSS